MDLPEESLHLSPEEQERISKYVERSMEKGRKKFEKYVFDLKKQGYTKEEIEFMLD